MPGLFDYFTAMGAAAEVVTGLRFSTTEPAADTLRKDRRVNLRLSSRDLDAIKKRALLEGLPYQTLISSVIHRYAAGTLKETDR